MRTLLDSTLWLCRKLLFLLTMALGILMLLLLPTMLTLNEPPKPLQRVFYYHLEAARWWQQVTFHLKHLWHGQIIPPFLTADEVGNNLRLIKLAREQEVFWRGVARTWWPSLLTTLKLVGPALVAGLVLGVLVGWLLSTLGPRWARRPAWGLTAVLSSLPDLLIATALDLGLVLVGMALGRPRISDDMKLYGHFIGPVLALALLILPYVARVTAAAIEEVASQLYVRTAMAKGVHHGQLVVKHIGKPVLIQVWTALPVVIAMLISGTAIVEYMMEIPGLGRALILFVGPGGSGLYLYKDPYAGVLLVAPLLLLFTGVTALCELGLRKLDPRVAARS
ncbi:MAG TPA: ABC transporter permease, partial [Symbiobacteriaceae bacterium]|nr:ABC transporter permease [Symbiobacteriaceae bacterium]